MGRLRSWLWMTLSCHALFLQKYAYDNIQARLALTFSVVEHGTLSIDAFAEDTQDKSFFDGHFYSDKAPGPSFALVPVLLVFKALTALTGVAFPMLLFRLVGHVVVLGVPTAITAWIIFRVVRRWSRNDVVGTLAATGWMLGTPALAYGTALYGHQWAAACLAIGWWLLRVDPRRGMRAGAITMLAWWGDYPALVFSGALLVLMGLTSSRVRRAWRAILAGALLPVVGMMLYNASCFGSPFVMSYAYKHLPEFASIHDQGVYGVGLPSLRALWTLLFSLHKGLFVLSPWLLLAVAAFPLSRREARVPAAMVAIVTLVMSGFVDVEAGWSLGPRHLIVALPFAAMGLAGWRWNLLPVFSTWGASIAFNVVGTLTTIHIPPELDHVWRDFLLPLILAGYSSASLSVVVGLPSAIAHALTLAVILGWLVRVLGMRVPIAFLGAVPVVLLLVGVPWFLVEESPLKALAVGRHLMAFGDAHAAEPWLAKTTQPEALELRERALRKLGRLDDAVAIWDGVPTRQALVLFELGKLDDALALLREHPAAPDASTLAGLILVTVGRAQEGRDLLATPSAQAVPDARRRQLYLEVLRHRPSPRE